MDVPANANYSDDAIAALLGTDLSAQEKALLLQQQQANQLRGQAMQPSAKRDFGSQGARALQGIGAAYGDIQYQKDFDKYKTDKAQKNADAIDILLKRKKMGAQTGSLTTPTTPGSNTMFDEKPMTGPVDNSGAYNF